MNFQAVNDNQGQNTAEMTLDVVIYRFEQGPMAPPLGDMGCEPQPYHFNLLKLFVADAGQGPRLCASLEAASPHPRAIVQTSRTVRPLPKPKRSHLSVVR